MASVEKFPNFMKLPDHVLINVISFCDFETKLKLLESCRHLNKLISLSPKMMKNFRFKISHFGFLDPNLKFVLGALATAASAIYPRKYQSLCLSKIIPENAPIGLKKLVIQNLMKIGKTVTELELKMEESKLTDVIDLFRCFPLLEHLQFNQKFVAINSREISNENLFPKLKNLKYICFDVFPLKIFSNVNTLEEFCFENYANDTRAITGFLENLLLKQQNLKNLKLVADESMYESLDLFRYDDLSEIKFQLEILDVTGLTICVIP